MIAPDGGVSRPRAPMLGVIGRGRDAGVIAPSAMTPLAGSPADRQQRLGVVSDEYGARGSGAVSFQGLVPDAFPERRPGQVVAVFP